MDSCCNIYTYTLSFGPIMATIVVCAGHDDDGKVFFLYDISWHLIKSCDVVKITTDTIVLGVDPNHNNCERYPNQTIIEL